MQFCPQFLRSGSHSLHWDLLLSKVYRIVTKGFYTGGQNDDDDGGCKMLIYTNTTEGYLQEALPTM